MMDETERAHASWAQETAAYITEVFSDAVAIDTANYQICGFILAAAELASQDPELAARIGALMEPQRPSAPRLRELGP